MTISSTTRKAGPFVGNGVTTEFPFYFKLFDTSDLRVVRADALGVETDLVHVTDCTVTLNADQDENPGGSVVLNAPLAEGTRLVLLSSVPELQPVDLTNQGGFYPELLNGGLDRNTVLVQQLREQMGRSITVPVTADPGDLALPSPVPGQLLAWSDDGLTNLDPSSLISVVAYGSTRVDKFDGDGTTTTFSLSSTPGVQNNLRVSIGGVMQTPGEDFTWAGGVSLSFAVAPPAETRIVAQYQEALVELGSANADFSNVDPAVGRAALGLGSKLQRAELLTDLENLSSSQVGAFVLGRVATGDGYAGVFIWVSGDQSAEVTADPLKAVWVAPNSAPTGVSGAWRRVTNGEVRLDWFGAAGDGVADDTVALASWLGLAQRYSLPANGSTRGGTFMVTQLVLDPIVRDIEIHIPAGMTIKGLPGSTTSVVRLRCGSVPARAGVLIHGGGVIDSSLRSHIPNVASGTCLELLRVQRIRIRDIKFTSVLGMGDSGIAAEQCGDIIIDGCSFYGHTDIGIYLTGGGSVGPEDDWGDVKVVNCHFEGCTGGVTARRQIGRVIYANNTFKDCSYAMQVAEAQSAVWVPAGRVVIAIGNVIENADYGACDFRAAAPGSIVASNTVTGWGASAATSAIFLGGCKGVSCTGNVIVFNGTPANHAAITIGNYTDGGGTVHTGQNNSAVDNTIIDAPVGVRDLSTGPNFVGNNPMVGVTTAYVGINNQIVQNENGFGVGVSAPASPIHARGAIRTEHDSIAAQYVTFSTTGSGAQIESWSAPSNAKAIAYRARTDASNTAPTSGALDHIFFDRTAELFRIKATGAVKFRALTADPSGVEDGDMWRRSDLNEIRVRLGATTYKLNVAAV